MIKSIITISLLLASNNVFCQELITPLWVKEEISNVGDAEAWGINVDSDGNIFWATSTEIDDLGLDIKCYNFNAQGEEQWPTPFLLEDSGTQHAYICNSDENYVYIGGRNCPGLVNTCDMYLLKVDKFTQEVQWERSLNFSGNGYDEVDAIHLDDDGIICGGWAQELQSTPFQSEMGLWKLDYEGNTIWTNFLGKENSAEHIDGHFVVDNDNIFAAGLWGGTSISNLYNGYAFLGKFSKSDGSLIDSTLFGNKTNAFLDIENALGMTSDGEFLYITGYATPTSPDNWQLFLAKYDKQMNQIWYVDWGGSGSESARGIKYYNGAIYIAGLTESEEFISSNVERMGVLMSFDTDGNLLNYNLWGQDQKINFHDLDIHDNQIYVTGTSHIGTVKKGFLFATDEITSSTKKVNPGSHFEVYPNPSLGYVNIKIDNPSGNKLEYKLMNSEGKTLEASSVEDSEIKVYLNNPGVYYVQLFNNEVSSTRKIINWR